MSCSPNDTLIAYALDHRRSRYLLTITYSLADDVTVVSACTATRTGVMTV